MAIGRRKSARQAGLWVSTSDLARSPGHPFYERVNGLLAKAGFDTFVEARCAKFYAEKMGRPGLAPGVYVRMLLVGYFEGLDSERGIAWRCADSLALRGFLGLTLSESPADHSTVSRTRRLIDLETHAEIFGFVLKLLAEHGRLLSLRGGRPLKLVAVSARSRTKKRDIDISGVRWEKDPLALATAPDIDVVVELIGGSGGIAPAHPTAQLDILLIIKLTAMVFLFNQDGSRQSLAVLVLFASLVYL